MSQLTEDIVEQSYRLFVEGRETPHIEGLEPREYVALLMFVDAFADIAIHEHPQIADRVQKPGKDIVETVVEYLDGKGIDPLDYLDLDSAGDMIRKVDKFWGGKMTVNDLVKFDREALGDLVLGLMGHDHSLADHPRARKFLQDQEVSIPDADDIGWHMDPGRYKAAYEALRDAGVLRESKIIRKYLDRARGELEAAVREADRPAKQKLEEILHQLDALGYE